MHTTITPNGRKGMTAFGIVWIGQLISFIGSGLTSFAVGVWVYQANGSITQFALISLFIFLPRVILGPLADRVFEPLMAVHGPLANNIGRIIGTGPGRGAGLLLICMGLLLMLASVISYLYPRLRLLEDELPDMTPDIIAGMETRDSVTSAAFQRASPAS